MSTFDELKEKTLEELKESIQSSVSTTLESLVEGKKANYESMKGKRDEDLEEEEEDESGDGEGSDDDDPEGEGEEEGKKPLSESAKAGKLVHSEKSGGNEVKVYWSSADNEYVAKLFKNGKHYEPADYFTDDKNDAMGTAKKMAKGR